MLLNLAFHGKWVMVKKKDSGKTSGFGSATLATQYWDFYSLANEHNVTIDRVWDGVNLKITFGRCFSQLNFLILLNLFTLLTMMIR